MQKEKIGDLYDKKTIRLTGTGFVQNGIYHKRGFYNQKITSLFAENKLASRHLNRSKKASLVYKPLKNIGLVATIYGLGNLLTFDLRTKNQLKTGFSVMLIGTACTIAAIPLRTQADDHLAKAVWFYNRDILTTY